MDLRISRKTAKTYLRFRAIRDLTKYSKKFNSISITQLFLKNKNENVILVSQDFNMRLRASCVGIEVVDYKSEVISKENSIDVQIGGTTHLSMSANTMNVTTGSITSNYMHLAKYITDSGDLDFNI